MLGANLGQRALMICVSWIILSRAQFIKPWLKDTSLSPSLSASPWSAQGLRGALRLRCMSWPGALFTPRLVFGYSDELLTVAFHCQILHPPFTSLHLSLVPQSSSRHADTFLRAKNWNRKLKLCSTCHKLVSAIGWQFSRRCHVSKCFAIFSRPPNKLLPHPLSTNPLDSLSCKQHACLGFLSHLIAFLLVFYSLLVLLWVCAGVSVFECCLPQQEYCVCVSVWMCVCGCVCVPLRIQIGLVWPRCDAGTFSQRGWGGKNAWWRKRKQG